MKKFTQSLILLLSCTMLLLAGCSGQDNTKVAIDNADYRIIKQNYVDRNIMINYPEIAGLADQAKQKEINELIKKEAFHLLNQYSEEELNRFYLTLDCEIKLQNPEILSIAYSGYRNLQGSAHPTHVFFTTNINICDGSRLRIKDLINVDNDFAEKIKNGRYFPRSVQIPLARIRPVNSELIRGLSTADWPGYPQNKYGTYTYFTSGTLGMSIEIPHPYGDYIEIEVRYEDIANNVKSENKIWGNIY